MNSLIEIRDVYAAGSISREDFWRAMQASHVRLREYQALIANGEVASIEITADELRVATTAGIRLVWYPEDLRTAPDVLVNSGTYEPAESALLMRAAQGARVIFDIGANVGYYSLHWTKALAAGGSVHAFEPVPTTFARLERNIALNGLAGVVRSNNLGLGEQPGSITLFIPSFSGSSAASIRNLHPEEESIEVEARIDTLDSYFARAAPDALDLIKIDVEGAELLVLKGGMDTIRAHRPLLFMELLRKWSKPFGYHPNDVITLLGQLGYRCFSLEDDRVRSIPDITEETVQTNFFFADPDRHAAWLSACGAMDGQAVR